ncbi:hypothetical protein H206_00759 [Candidatus Electrothrix aarhusensis]|uniref:Uncharacterized protein n=1 Tax=Candidatus Electrothrix aarhusensis TaxID=1859131 RepID=A0A444IZM5_9BACT|nr:hypothetical protein H206_00759 [Candidatus Electrothrix aarhusensis]
MQRSFDEVKDTVEDSLRHSFSSPEEAEPKKSGDADTGSSNTAADQQAKEDQEALAALREFQKGKK